MQQVLGEALGICSEFLSDADPADLGTAFWKSGFSFLTIHGEYYTILYLTISQFEIYSFPLRPSIIF